MPPSPIDIVIPHVDGRAPGYLQAHARLSQRAAPCHMRDLGELRFVLRSIARHAPWARQLWLAVMDDGHVPSWIDRTRVRVVTHDAFIPAALRPTFHCATVLAHLHEIPGLAERFVLWEDDMLALQALPTEAMFSPAGAPRTDTFLGPIVPQTLHLVRHGYQHVLVETLAALQRALQRNGDLSSLRRVGFLYPHMPLPVLVRSARALTQALGDDAHVQHILARKHRGTPPDEADIDPNVLLANWQEITETKRSTLARFARMTGQLATRELARRSETMRRAGHLRFASYPLRNDAKLTQRHMQRMLRERPRFASINDEAYDRGDGPSDCSNTYDPNPAALAAMHEALHALFPDPCHFERG